MKSIKCLVLIFILTSIVHVNAKDNIPDHSVGLELGGKGLLYSLNYEYNFHENFVASIGYSFLNVSESDIDKSSIIMSFPISASYLLSLNEEHRLEFGLALTNLITTGDLVEYEGNTDYFLNPNLIIGYRFYPIDSRWHFKAMLTPFLGTKSLTKSDGTSFQPFGSTFQIWGGLGVGFQL